MGAPEHARPATAAVTAPVKDECASLCAAAAGKLRALKLPSAASCLCVDVMRVYETVAWGLNEAVYAALHASIGTPRFAVHSEGCVVVTGSSTGIGADLSLALAARGYVVFAGVRKQEDGEALKRKALIPNNIIALLLDVTRPDHIYNALRTVQERLKSGLGGGRLIALVNNAGVTLFAPTETATSGEVSSVFNINIFGAINLCQKFLPLLRESKGRIVMMSSVAEYYALPYQGAYAGSKHAMGAFTDSLRQECLPYGVSVSLVEPGLIKTDIVKKSAPAYNADADKYADPSKAHSVYSAHANKFFRFFMDMASMNGADPRYVSNAVVHALTSPFPQTRYFVGWDAKALATFRPFLPDRIVDWTLAKVCDLYAKNKNEEAKKAK